MPTELETLARDPETNPLTLGRAMDAATSKEWRDWLPETCADFVKISDDDVQQRDKLMAVQVGLTNPDVFEDWHCFLACVIAFNHRRVNFEWLDKPSIPELAWGCVVLNKLRPDGQYSEQVLRFIDAVMQHEGLLYFPWAERVLRGADETIVAAMKKAWSDGELKELAPSEVAPDNLLHNQFAQLVNAQAYIRAQKAEA